MEKQFKLSHITLLARALLPGDAAPDVASTHIHSLSRLLHDPPTDSTRHQHTSDDEEPNEEDELAALQHSWSCPRPSPSPAPEKKEESRLRDLRAWALERGAHAQTWSNNFVPAFLCSVGDIGYIGHTGTASYTYKGDGSRILDAWGGFERFVRVGNVFEMELDASDEMGQTEEELQGMKEMRELVEKMEVAVNTYIGINQPSSATFDSAHNQQRLRHFQMS